MADITPGLNTLEEDEKLTGPGAAVKATGKGLSPVGTIAMDPTQTEELLANMQGMVNERTGAFSTFERGLQRASAYGSGGEKGPAAALTAMDQQKLAEDRELFNMRQQMAALRSSAAQQKAFNEEQKQLFGGAGGAGSAGGAGAGAGMVSYKGINIPQELAVAMKGKRTREERDALFDKWTLKNAEIYAQPGMDEPKIPDAVWDDAQGKWVSKLISTREFRNKYPDKPIPAAAAQPSATTTTAPADTLSAIKTGIFNQESLGGKLDTSKPNYAGAVGPMQIMPDTFEGLKKEKLIPQNYDINNPQHNKAAGNALIDKYYKQYGGNVDKVMAAYYGGPSAIKADGTIDVNRRDPRNPNAPTVGEYIEQAKQKAGLTTAPAEVARPPKPVSAQALQKQEEVDIAGAKAQAETEAQASKKEIENFKAGTDKNAVTNQLYLSNRLNEILEKNKDNPRLVALINDPGMGNAIATIMSKGLTTPFGQVGAPSIEDAVQLVMKDVKIGDVNTRREIQSILAAYALEASKVAQGQGAMSDFERLMFEKIAGSTSQGMDMLRRTQRVMASRAQFNDKIGDLFDTKYKRGTMQDYQEFKKSAEYKQAVAEHRQRLTDITKDLEKNPSRIGMEKTKPAAAPLTYKDPNEEAAYQAWKKQQSGKK